MFGKLMEVSPVTWGAVVALLAVGVILLILYRDKQRWTVTMLVNAAMSLAVAFVLSCIRIFRMPQGGSITPASTLPIMMFAYAYGFAPGLLVGMAYGMLQLMQDLYFVHPMQLLLDYPLAFGMLALAGLLKEWKASGIQIALGCLIGGLGRTMMHVISGALYFAEYAGDLNPWIYSLGYSFSSVFVDAVICAVIVVIPPVAKFVEKWSQRCRGLQRGRPAEKIATQ